MDALLEGLKYALRTRAKSRGFARGAPRVSIRRWCCATSRDWRPRPISKDRTAEVVWAARIGGVRTTTDRQGSAHIFGFVFAPPVRLAEFNPSVGMVAPNPMAPQARFHLVRWVRPAQNLVSAGRSLRTQSSRDEQDCRRAGAAVRFARCASVRPRAVAGATAPETHSTARRCRCNVRDPPRSREAVRLPLRVTAAVQANGDRRSRTS